MVLAYYGVPQSPRRLKALASGSDYSPGQPFNDYSITPYVALIPEPRVDASQPSGTNVGMLLSGSHSPAGGLARFGLF